MVLRKWCGVRKPSLKVHSSVCELQRLSGQVAFRVSGHWAGFGLPCPRDG